MTSGYGVPCARSLGALAAARLPGARAQASRAALRRMGRVVLSSGWIVRGTWCAHCVRMRLRPTRAV